MSQLPPLSSAASPDPSVRRDLGVALAGQPELDGVSAGILHLLLLDTQNTAVTFEVAEALLARGDLDGVRLVVEALVEADDDTANWLDDAANGAAQEPESWRALQDHLLTFTEPPEQSAARRLLAYIGAPTQP